MIARIFDILLVGAVLGVGFAWLLAIIHTILEIA